VATQAWVLLLQEGEAVSPELAAEITARVRASSACAAYRVRREIELFGRPFEIRGAPVRLARREAAVLRIDAGLGVRLGGTGAAGRISAALAAPPLTTLSSALEQVDAGSTLLAHLLDAADARPSWYRLLLAPLVAGGGALTGRARRRLGWGRWVFTVFEAYCPVATYAKLWELRRQRVTVPA
jgi:hypothetical protein